MLPLTHHNGTEQQSADAIPCDGLFLRTPSVGSAPMPPCTGPCHQSWLKDGVGGRKGDGDPTTHSTAKQT